MRTKNEIKALIERKRKEIAELLDELVHADMDKSDKDIMENLFRSWTREEADAFKKSIKETNDLFR